VDNWTILWENQLLAIDFVFVTGSAATCYHSGCRGPAAREDRRTIGVGRLPTSSQANDRMSRYLADRTRWPAIKPTLMIALAAGALMPVCGHRGPKAPIRTPRPIPQDAGKLRQARRWSEIWMGRAALRRPTATSYGLTRTAGPPMPHREVCHGHQIHRGVGQARQGGRRKSTRSRQGASTSPTAPTPASRFASRAASSWRSAGGSVG
jgi:hypothetical protein